jgi:hypothetical protein
MEPELKITTFSPLIVTRKPEKNIKLFEKLGFETIHMKQMEGNVVNCTMRDAEGHQVDITKSRVEQDTTVIRMNVPDFDAAFAMLQEEGFKIKRGHIVETESSKSATVVSPTGFAFDLCQHIRKKK